MLSNAQMCSKQCHGSFLFIVLAHEPRSNSWPSYQINIKDDVIITRLWLTRSKWLSFNTRTILQSEVRKYICEFQKRCQIVNNKLIYSIVKYLLRNDNGLSWSGHSFSKRSKSAKISEKNVFRHLSDWIVYVVILNLFAGSPAL